MTYLKWLLLALANVAMMLTALVLAPILPAFARPTGYLPTWLKWFQTPDNSLDGDAGFQGEHAPFSGTQTGWRRYVNRVAWLVRNPSYGFDIDVLGVTIAGPVQTRGPSALGGALVQGWYFARAPGAFQFYAVVLWGSRMSRVDIGWKLWSAPGACQFALTISPFGSAS